MELIRPDILRAIPVSLVVHLIPWYWWRGLPMVSLSKVTHGIDEFISHCWQAAAWQKYINILLLYQALPAFGVATFFAIIAFVLYALDILPASDVTTLKSAWCLGSGVGAFYLALLLSYRRSMVFLDLACIHQEDRRLKAEGILSMGGFLKRSKSMLVLWGGRYVQRLWCVFELSAFIHSHGERASIRMCPPLLGPTLLGGHFAFSVGSLLLLNWHWEREGLDVGRALFGLVCVPAFTFAVHSVRAYFRSIDLLDKQLRQFSISECQSSCCEAEHPNGMSCDRQVLNFENSTAFCIRSSKNEACLSLHCCGTKVLLSCISKWFGSVQAFELCVQSDVRARMVHQLANDTLTYPRILLAARTLVRFRTLVRCVGSFRPFELCLFWTIKFATETFLA